VKGRNSESEGKVVQDLSDRDLELKSECKGKVV
jgi:hypothetical protein